MTALLIILGALTIGGAIAAMTLRNLIHSVLALVIAFAGLATLYLQLGAQFVGLAQILVYIGAVAILTVFAILLTRGTNPIWTPPPPSWIVGVVVAVAVFGVLARSILASSILEVIAPPVSSPTVKQIGIALMGPFVLPLEVLGLLLTGALVGAVIIAIHEGEPTL